MQEKRIARKIKQKKREQNKTNKKEHNSKREPF